MEGTFGSVKTYDSILKRAAARTNGRHERNMSFRSSISEVSLMAELHLFFVLEIIMMITSRHGLSIGRERN